ATDTARGRAAAGARGRGGAGDARGGGAAVFRHVQERRLRRERRDDGPGRPGRAQDHHGGAGRRHRRVGGRNAGPPARNLRRAEHRGASRAGAGAAVRADAALGAGAGGRARGAVGRAGERARPRAGGRHRPRGLPHEHAGDGQQHRPGAGGAREAGGRAVAGTAHRQLRVDDQRHAGRGNRAL
ncbi:MAG: hypothetical protein AVDCRST_MAG89-2275, partial [uncultured Gemmatimonadetes bacterium]